MTDPIAQFIRAEREALHQQAPPPHAARIWHEARRRRAAHLRRTTMIAGWAGRAVFGSAAAAGFFVWPNQARSLLLLFILFSWLTRSACAPAGHRSAEE